MVKLSSAPWLFLGHYFRICCKYFKFAILLPATAFTVLALPVSATTNLGSHPNSHSNNRQNNSPNNHVATQTVLSDSELEKRLQQGFAGLYDGLMMEQIAKQDISSIEQDDIDKLVTEFAQRATVEDCSNPGPNSRGCTIVHAHVNDLGKNMERQVYLKNQQAYKDWIKSPALQDMECSSLLAQYSFFSSQMTTHGMSWLQLQKQKGFSGTSEEMLRQLSLYMLYATQAEYAVSPVLSLNVLSDKKTISYSCFSHKQASSHAPITECDLPAFRSGLGLEGICGPETGPAIANVLPKISGLQQE